MDAWGFNFWDEVAGGTKNSWFSAELCFWQEEHIFNFQTGTHRTHSFLGTEEHKNIFLFSRKDAKGAKFLEPLMDFFVSRRRRGLSRSLKNTNFCETIILTKEHNAPRPCLEFFTRNTLNHAEWIVSRRRRGLSRSRAEQILWSSVSSVWNDNSDRRTKGHNAPRTCLEFFTRNSQIFLDRRT